MNPSTFLTRARSLAGALSGAQQASLLAAFAFVVLLVGGSSYWLSRPDYVLLFSDLDPEGAADVVSKLKTEKVAYQLDQGGRSIRVPATQADELRLQFASQGLPSSGRIGFEIFDRTQFGATEFLEQVNYRRALEGEIGRTIATLGDVAGARVHIAMEHSSLFESREQPAKASVVLKLKSNRRLADSTISGIRNLVAASVEGLRPEAVVILDTYGRSLAKPPSDDGDGAVGGAQLERQQQIEHDLSTKLVSLLEPVVGVNRVRVNVAARLDSETEEQTEEKYDPSGVIRSQQTSGDAVATPQVVQGAAGARANLPPSAAQAAQSPPPPTLPPAALSASRGNAITNYEVGKTIRHTVRPIGGVSRLSVAVIVDDEPSAQPGGNGAPTRTMKPRSAAELQKIQALVVAAAGIDQTRGDQVTVENIAFDEPTPDTPAPPTFWEKSGPLVIEALRVLGILVALVLGFVFVVRPLMRSLQVPAGAVAPGLPAAAGAAGTAALPEIDIEAQLDAAAATPTLEARKVPVLTKRIGGLAQKEPEHAARLLRMWINEDAR